MHDSKKNRARRKVRAVVPPRLIHELGQALERAANSARYGIVESLDISTLIKGKGKVEIDIQGVTLAEVVAGGADRFCEYPGIGPVKVRNLIKFLKGLAGESVGADTLTDNPGQALEISTGHARDSVNGTADLPILSSVQAEQAITKAIGELKAQVGFSEIRSRLLGEFWDPAWPGAPFEQSLRLGQVIELQPNYLLKKNSFYGKKITAFVRAIERAAQCAANLNSPDTTTQYTHPSVAQATDPETKRLTEWANSGGPWSTLLRSSLLFFASELGRVAGRKNMLTQFAVSLTREVNVSEFLWLWALEQFGTEQAAILMKERGTGSSEDLASIRARVAGLLTNRFATLRGNWEALMMGPGVSTFLLAEPYIDVEWDRGLQELLVNIAVRSLGAQHPYLGEKEYEQYWTLNPRAFDTAINAVRLLQKSEPNELEQRVAALLPYFNAHEIISSLN